MTFKNYIIQFFFNAKFNIDYIYNMLLYKGIAYLNVNFLSSSIFYLNNIWSHKVVSSKEVKN